MARNVRLDFRRGGGSSLEVLYGKVSLTPTLLHTVGTSVVLPAPSTFDLINGVAIATNVAPSPDPVDGLVDWAYIFKITDNFGKSWEYMAGVPDGTTEINFNVLPRYFTTKPPLFGQGPQGVPGEAATIEIGAVGATPPGSEPVVTNTGTANEAVLNFELPRGEVGPQGVGVPDGGTALQIIRKDAANVTTEWATLDKAIVGLGNVDNTADAVKPLSTPQKSYVDLSNTLPARTKTVTDLPSSYPSGVTAAIVSPTEGWPGTAGSETNVLQVVTCKNPSNFGAITQWLSPFNDPTQALQYRVSKPNDTWGDFCKVATEAFVEAATGIVNVKSFGAKGDGATDDTEAIIAALEYAPSGSTVLFPRGSYYSPVLPRLSDGTGWIRLTKPVHLKGEVGTTLDGFAFWVQGEADTLKPLTSSALVGDNIVNTSAHGLVRDDYVQMFTSFNAYTTDAGRFQMGSKNPTTGLTWDCRAGQITRVVQATADQFETASRLLYDYKNNTTGQTQTIPGVPGSEYRRLTPLRGVVVEGITFLHNRGGSAKGWTIRLTQGLKFVDCRWEVGLPADGTTLVVTDSYGFKMTGCEVEHSFTQNTNSGSGANLILIGAGCSNVRIEDSLFTRGSQIIDIITNDIPQNPGTQNLLTKSTLRSVSDVLISNNKFFDNVNAFTSHPATDGLVFEGNVVVGAGVGCHSRGRNTKIIGNSIESFIQGIGISAFAHNTQIVGNVLEQTDAQNSAPNGWTGVQITPFGVEIITHNKLENVNILSNTITARYGIGYPSYGVMISSNNANSPDVTDAQRIAQSDIAITGNTMKECGIRLNEFIAGVRISKNEIRIVGGTLTAGCIRLGHNTAACQVVDNVLTSTTSQLDVFGRDDSGSLLRPYDARHLIGNNTIIGTKNTSIIGDIRTFDRLGYVTLSGNTPSIPGPHAADTQKTVAVTFPQAFNTPPSVVLASNAVGVQGIPVEVTKTGFTASFRTTAAYNYNIGGQYSVTGFVA